MCGRYTLTSPLEGVRQVFDFVERPNLAPRFNIAPTQEVAAVRLGDDGARHFVALRWGLIPAWAKDAAIASRLINARGETVAEKRSFRSAFAQRRCLIIADGFCGRNSRGITVFHDITHYLSGIINVMRGLKIVELLKNSLEFFEEEHDGRRTPG